MDEKIIWKDLINKYSYIKNILQYYGLKVGELNQCFN